MVLMRSGMMCKGSGRELRGPGRALRGSRSMEGGDGVREDVL